LNETGPGSPGEPALAPEEREALLLGARQFNAGLYFECHDTLEEAWSGLRGPARDFFQGLIQVAVAFYHWRNGNAGGALSLLARARKRLGRYGDRYLGLDLGALRSAVEDVRRRIAEGEAFPAEPAGLPVYAFRDEERSQVTAAQGASQSRA
jgi:predicted metal-dependent hydrolase